MALEGERLPARELADLRHNFQARAKYALASTLWCEGRMEWEQALAVAVQAFKDVPVA